MSAVSVLRAIPKPILAPVSPWHLHPRIVLERCPHCDAGRKRFRANGRLIDEACAWCAGRGTIVRDNA